MSLKNIVLSYIKTTPYKSPLCAKTLPSFRNLATCFSTFQLNYKINSELRIADLSAAIYQRSVQTSKITELFCI